MSRRLLPLLVAFAALAGALPAAVIEPVVATSWDVRRDAQELLEDLAKPGAVPPLLERVQAMLAAHGDKLIHHGTWFAPLSEVLAERLAARGLVKDFVAIYGEVADRRLRALMAARAEDAEVRRLARTYPGTPAAARAWSWLANRSWDRGQLGQYLAYARLAGEPGDRTLSGRVEAARKLLSPALPATVPSALDLEEMWRIDLDESEVKPPRAPMLRGARVPTGKRAFALSDPRDDLTAASDGRHLFLVDHLLGRIQGGKHPLGDTYLTVRQCVPAAGSDCFVAIGMLQPARATLACIDRLGELRWHITTPGFGPYPTLSAPRICDDLVAFAALAINEDGPELRAYAYRLADGKPAWDVLIAKLPNLIHHRGFDETRFGSLAPTLCSHAGSLLVLSNAGVIARLSSGGAVERIWTYPSTLTALQEPLGLPQRNEREGALHSDGYWAVATPADALMLTLILGPDDSAPRQYTADGSSAEVLDVADGIALLGGGKHVHCLELAQGKLRWSRGPALEERPAGRIGGKRALVCGRDRLSLIDLASGDLIDDKGFSSPFGFSTAEGLLMIGERAAITAWGNSRASLDEQLAAAQRNPQDFRPLIRLYSLLQAQGDSAKAYDYLVQALRRGAPPEYSEKAARLVRLRLETALGDAQAFPPLLAQLADLATWNPGLATEAALWRGRHAEARKDAAAATAAYQHVLKQPNLRLVLGDRLETQAQCLAQAGLHRLKLIAAPAWLGSAGRPAPTLATPASGWSLPGRRRRGELLTADLVIGYVDGLLTAQRLSDGGTVWKRKPTRPLLGVQTMQGGNAQRGGIAVQVIEGTSAEVAGIRTGDLLVEFNGKALTEFPDLVNAVADTGSEGEFTAKVQRAGQVLALTGRLGGDLVEPVAANASTVLVWPMFPERNSSEGMWVTALDLATGAQLWHGTLPPVTAEQPPQRPVLTAGDLVITADGDDLVGMQLRGAAGAEERWRLRGLGDWLGQCQLLGANLALIADAGHGQARMIDTASGETVFAMPGDGEVPALLADGELFARLLDNRLACWDLGQARLRWKSERPVHAAIAAGGDALFVLGDRKQLMVVDRFSGKVRRLYGNWGPLDEWATAGDRLYAYVRRADLSQALVSIGIPSGAVLWELPLPRGAQLKKLSASSEGAAAVIEDREETAVIALRPDGSTRQAHLVDGSDNVWFLRGALLAVGRAGMRVLSPEPPPATAPVPALVAAPQGDLEKTALAALPRLTWQRLGAAAYALARVDQALLVFARLPASVDTLELRLGDAGPLIDPLNQDLVIQRHKISKFADLPDAWQQSGALKLPAQGDDWLYVVQLTPPLGRGVGVPVELRATAAGASDCPPGPWWFRPLWRQVQAAP